ncbi:hypothetical protein BLA29_007774 [Euroglyphus maynei]|uniref:Uncharacterized protein n=1 Tax=Euroglyphus maynei TaxID=6958 RepID=A0A1Y3APR3_EURMA|nr:hypothetical protein BLA29_007774 [Euroglyphus maynei]
MSVTFHPQNSGPSSPFPLSASAGLNGKKSAFRWTTSVRRRQQQRRTPTLKRAASFNDNSGKGGYARLVQSTSSPSSPELIHGGEYPSNDIVGLNINSRPKLIRPTALLGASDVKSPSSSSSTLNRRRNKKINSAPDSFDDSTIDDDYDDTDTNIVILSPTSEMQNNNKIMIDNKRKKRNLTKSSSSHYHQNIYDDDDDERRNRSGDNELYNFDTKNRLLNISLEASSQQEQKMAMKPFLLDLPKTGTNNGLLGTGTGNIGGGGLQVPDGCK